MGKRGAPKGAMGDGSNAGFLDTDWSVVLRARQGDSPRAQAALDSLCRGYGYPLCA